MPPVEHGVSQKGKCWQSHATSRAGSQSEREVLAEPCNQSSRESVRKGSAGRAMPPVEQGVSQKGKCWQIHDTSRAGSQSEREVLAEPCHQSSMESVRKGSACRAMPPVEQGVSQKGKCWQSHDTSRAGSQLEREALAEPRHQSSRESVRKGSAGRAMPPVEHGVSQKGKRWQSHATSRAGSQLEREVLAEPCHQSS